MLFEFTNNQHSHSFKVAHDTIVQLSYSQGFYSRMRRDMEESEWVPLYELTSHVEFNEPLDFILYIEC